MDVNPQLFMLVGWALQSRKNALRIGLWSSCLAKHTLVPGLKLGSALSPVLFNVYTAGTTSSQLEGPDRNLVFAKKQMAFSKTLSKIMTELKKVTFALTWARNQIYSRIVFPFWQMSDKTTCMLIGPLSAMLAIS